METKKMIETLIVAIVTVSLLGTGILISLTDFIDSRDYDGPITTYNPYTFRDFCNNDFGQNRNQDEDEKKENHWVMLRRLNSRRNRETSNQ